MKSVNEYVIYFNPRGEQVPALAQIRRSSMELHGVEGPDCMDLIYADPTPEAVARGDLREIAKIAHSVLHFSHPKGDRSVDGPLANCWMTAQESQELCSIACEQAEQRAIAEAGGSVAEEMTGGAQSLPSADDLDAEAAAKTATQPPEPGVLAQLEAAGPAPLDPGATTSDQSPDAA